MFPRMLRRLLFAAALLSLAPACGDKQNLQKIEAPAAGVTLSYDLTPGQVYRGNVTHSEKVQSADVGGSYNRSYSFAVDLSILGPDEQHGGQLVMARFKDIKVNWTLPRAFPISLNEFIDKVVAQLKNSEVTFAVDETGKVLFMPELPEDMSTEMRLIVQGALDALETAFLPVPARPLKPGDTWKDQRKRGREGKLGRFVDAEVTTKVEGFYRAGERGDEEVTRLDITEAETETVTTKAGAHKVTKDSQTKALFAHAKKYLVKLDRSGTSLDPGVSTTFTTLVVRWTKDAAKSTPAPASPTGPIKQTQSIDDPCHPDYVGGEECQTTPTEPPPPAGPAGEATPTKPPA